MDSEILDRFPCFFSKPVLTERSSEADSDAHYRRLGKIWRTFFPDEFPQEGHIYVAGIDHTSPAKADFLVYRRGDFVPFPDDTTDPQLIQARKRYEVALAEFHAEWRDERAARRARRTAAKAMVVA